MNRYRFTVIAAVLCGFCGCIPVITTKIKPHSVVQYNAVSKVPLSVELRISEQYRTAVRRPTVDSKLVFGEYLALNTEDCVRAAFASVTVTKNSTNTPAIEGAQAILLPRLLHLDWVSPSGEFKGWTFSLAIEWELRNPSGRLIWVDTTKVQQDRGAGKEFYADFDAMTRRVMNESYRAFVEAPEIQAFANTLPR